MKMRRGQFVCKVDRHRLRHEVLGGVGQGRNIFSSQPRIILILCYNPHGNDPWKSVEPTLI